MELDKLRILQLSIKLSLVAWNRMSEECANQCIWHNLQKIDKELLGNETYCYSYFTKMAVDEFRKLIYCPIN